MAAIVRHRDRERAPPFPARRMPGRAHDLRIRSPGVGESVGAGAGAVHARHRSRCVGGAAGRRRASRPCSSLCCAVCHGRHRPAAGVGARRRRSCSLELVAVFLLRLRTLVVLGVVILLCTWGLWWWGAPSMIPGILVVISVSVVAIVAFARERQRLGLQGAPGDLMLVDLRDRLAAHGRVPPLPAGWRVDSEIRSAHADGFSGDFMVAGTRPGRHHPRDRAGRRVGQGPGRRRPLAAAVRGLRRAAGRDAARRVPRRRPTSTCSTRRGRRASPPRSTSPST